MKDRPLRLGFVGRVDYLQKRVERFIPLVRALDRIQLPFQLEFLGDGTGLPELKKSFQDRDNILFHGRQSGEAYWKAMCAWDFVIYTSDFEGSPLAMQEALNAGCIPVFPKIHCGGDLVVTRMDAELLYEPEDFAGVANTLSRWKQLPDARIQEVRQLGIAISHDYAEDRYHEKFMGFLGHLQSLPVLSRHPIPARRAFWKDGLPFGVLRRWFPKAFFDYAGRP